MNILIYNQTKSCLLTFNKTILDNTIDDVRLRLEVIHTKKNELQTVLSTLESIQDEEYLSRDADGKSIKLTRKKIDQGTGLDITNSRRNVIFDISIPKAESKLTEKI